MNMHHVLQGDGLLGRAVDFTGKPLDKGGPLSAVRVLAWADVPAGPAEAERSDGLWETGIKAIDFYAPIPRGGTVTFHASPGVGMVVVTAELIRQLATSGGCAVMALQEDAAYPLAETISGLREGGVESHVALVIGREDMTPGERHQTVRAALAAATGFCADGRQVLLVIDDALLLPQAIADLQSRLRHGAQGSLTLALRCWRHTTPEPALDPAVAAWLAAEEDARIVLSRTRALQKIWPAVDGSGSRSRLLADGHMGAAHAVAAAAARQLLRNHEQPGVADAATAARAQRVLLFGGQPFRVAEPYTAQPGVTVPYAETVSCYQAIIAGTYDQVPEERFRFIGALAHDIAH
jgi:F-type H+/Na+-transporting ATPase subunit beta